MEHTFEEIKAAAWRVRRRFFSDCWQSELDIGACEDLDDMRRVVIKYRQSICSIPCASFIVSEYPDMLDAVGLRLQRYVDGRMRLYLA
jgi:hypothetical protein